MPHLKVPRSVVLLSATVPMVVGCLSVNRRLTRDEACARGVAVRCVEAGRAYQLGVGVPRDESKAAELFKQACDRGDENGCLELAHLVLWGRADAGISAKELYEPHCGNGVGKGCDLKKRQEELDVIATKNPCPEVSSGSMSTSPDAGPLGSLMKDDIRKVIHLHREEIRYCYEQSLLGATPHEGKIAVKFVIAPWGSVVVQDVVEDSVHSPELQQCILEQIGRWRFPCPNGGGKVIVTYPFVFSAPKG